MALNARQFWAPQFIGELALFGSFLGVFWRQAKIGTTLVFEC